MHVVWEKFCRYFDVEPRIVPLQPGKYTIGPADVAPHVDENTIGVAAVLGTTSPDTWTTSVESTGLLLQIKQGAQHRRAPCASTAPAAAFVWPFLYPDSEWDFRLEQVRSINVSGHKFGLVYPGIGWLIFREKSDLAPDLVFEENYLGKTDATFTLNFSTGQRWSRPVLQPRPIRPRRLHIHDEEHADQRALLADKLRKSGGSAHRSPIRNNCRSPPSGSPMGPRLRRVRHRMAAVRRTGLDGSAYTLPPNAQNETIMRALVKETLSREHIDTLARDIDAACTTLSRKGRAHHSEREKVVTGPGH